MRIHLVHIVFGSGWLIVLFIVFYFSESSIFYKLPRRNALANPFDWILLEEDLCRTRTTPYFLMTVISAPGNFERRSLIRQTYGHPTLQKRYNFALVFILARARSAEKMLAIRDESSQYHDIVQQGFIDSYKNLTLKSVMMLQYAHEYCSDARMLIKADDDAFIDIFTLMQLIGKMRLNFGLVLALGTTHKNASVNRNEKGKFYVSWTD